MASGLKVTWKGLRTLKQQLDKAHKLTLAAARKSVDETSRKIQKGIRRDVDQLFDGTGGSQFRRRKTARRVSGAIRRKLYNNKNRGTAALIYSKFGRRRDGQFVDFLGPYITGRDITARRSRFMAIPMQPGRKNRTPGNVPDLSPVEIAGRVYLVKRVGRKTKFFFMLVPRVRVRKRLKARRIALAEARRMGILARRAFGTV